MGGDEDNHPGLALKIGQFVSDKSEAKRPFLWKFNKDGLAERGFLIDREGLR